LSRGPYRTLSAFVLSSLLYAACGGTSPSMTQTPANTSSSPAQSAVRTVYDPTTSCYLERESFFDEGMIRGKNDKGGSVEIITGLAIRGYECSDTEGYEVISYVRTVRYWAPDGSMVVLNERPHKWSILAKYAEVIESLKWVLSLCFPDKYGYIDVKDPDGVFGNGDEIAVNPSATPTPNSIKPASTPPTGNCIPAIDPSCGAG